MSSETFYPIEAIYLPDSSPYDASLQTWTERWWRWILSIAKPVNPAIDTTGKHCGHDQHYANVWFLAGTLGGKVRRQCVIPYLRAILFPIIIDEQSLSENPNYRSDSELEFRVEKEADAVLELCATIDGMTIPDLRRHRVHTKTFDITLPEDNIWGTKPGPTRAAADGYWLFLKPLSLGKHTLQFSGRGPHFSTETRYDISIMEDHK